MFLRFPKRINFSKRLMIRDSPFNVTGVKVIPFKFLSCSILFSPSFYEKKVCTRHEISSAGEKHAQGVYMYL